jgi:hypothetical protein
MIVQVKNLCSIALGAVLLLLPLTLVAQSNSLAVIQEDLSSRIQMTTVTADRWDLVTPGSVVELQRDGLVMYAVASPLPPSNTYKNGKISQGWGGFGTDLKITMAAPGGVNANDYPKRRFVAGEKCWITGITAQDDGIVLQLYSDVYGGIRYYANLKIAFPNKKEVPPLDAFLKMTSEVVSIQGPMPPQQVAAPSGPSIGQTKGDVVAVFGQPVVIAAVGTKEIFAYQDMKVTFIKGRVTKTE